MITTQVDIQTPDGTAGALLVHPNATGALPGIIVLTDGFGLRPHFDEVLERIADWGYVVLAPNIFYRTAKPPVFEGEIDFRNESVRKRFGELTGPLTPAAMTGDGAAYLDFLASQPIVSRGPMAIVGFCFSGQFALRVAAADSDRIAAAASFHGGGLVTDKDTSPHLVLPKVKARLYLGHAENDQSMPAEAIATLDAALKAWGGRYESEIYKDAKHGWMVDGRDVYHPQQAEHGFTKLQRLLELTFGKRTSG